MKDKGMDKDWDGKERRRYKRITKSFILTYFDKASPHQKFEMTQLKNISLGGMCFITTKQFTKGTVLQIELETPYLSEKTALEGTVIASYEKIKNMLYETRLEFLQLESQVEYLLEKMMEFFMNGDKNNHA